MNIQSAGNNSECAAFEESIPWYLNGSLDESQRVELRRHVDGCAECRETLAWWREVGHTVESVAASEESAAVPAPDRLLERVARQQRGSERRRLLLAASVMLGIASLLAALLANALHEPRFITVTDVAQQGEMLQVELQFTNEMKLADLAALLEQNAAVLERGPDARGWAVISLPLRDGESAGTVVERLAAEDQVVAVRPAITASPEERP